MACPHFHWQHIPLLEVWRDKKGCDGVPRIILESYRPGESIDVYKEALSGNSVSYELCLCNEEVVNFRLSPLSKMHK